MGERFGSYEIGEKLGEGGMAEVVSAIRRGHDGFARRVCIKRMLPEHENDPSMVELFGDEARIMAGLHHPAIVSVLEYGRHAGRSFLAMELVDGVDLRKVLRRTGVLSPELAVYVACELAGALDHAHHAKVAGIAMRVVHRDVTPSNVLVSRDGTIKLTDFGIAKASERAHVTQAGIVKGKVPYMAPEQALGLEVDQRADLFSLGVVLFELLCGRRPYDGPTDLDTLRNAQLGDHAGLRQLAPDVPRELEVIVHKLIQPRSVDRFASASALLDALSPLGSLAARRQLEKRVSRALEIAAPTQRYAEPKKTVRRPQAIPLAASPTRTELMPPSEIARIEETSASARPASRPSLELTIELGEATERQPRTPVQPSNRTLHIPPTRPSRRGTIELKLSAFVAITLAWLVLSVAAGVLWARSGDAPEIQATSLAGPP